MTKRDLIVAAAAGAALAGCGGTTPARTSTLPVPERTGDVRDFDFLLGGWTVENRTRKPGDAAWTEFASTVCNTQFLGGVVNVEETRFPSRGYDAIALRVFDVARRQWSIYWIESRAGILLPPVVGGFTGDRGEFYGPDELDGAPVVFRYVWERLGADRARWAQAFTADGTSWTENWIMEFTRTSTSCGGA